ncbi:hypothetical protein HKCCSP123_05230 [Rhodobacterales bacterium HKCCSP123]|nr:hypothetical protein [Rhodobacterales bacterium HKCCSP123]
MTETQPTMAETGLEASPAFAALMSANPVFAKAWLDLMSESARFLTERLHSDLETQKALMACKTPMDLMKVQAEFLNTAMQQYADEVARLMNMTVRASRDIANDLKSGHSRGYDDVPV